LWFFELQELVLLIKRWLLGSASSCFLLMLTIPEMNYLILSSIFFGSVENHFFLRLTSLFISLMISSRRLLHDTARYLSSDCAGNSILAVISPILGSPRVGIKVLYLPKTFISEGLGIP